MEFTEQEIIMNKKPQNIIILFADDQRYDTIFSLGNKQIKTPNIDNLVKSGTSFIQAHIPSGMVPAVCMPSRAMLHTGRSLYHLEGCGETIPSRFSLMGETFRNSGFESFGTGKWHNGTESYARSFSQGDEIMFGGMADHWNVPMCHFDQSGKYKTKAPMIHTPYLNNEVTIHTMDHIHPGCHSTDIICNSTLSFLESSKKDKPFFAYISFLAPHDPRSMPAKYLEMYNPCEIEIPDSFYKDHQFDFGVSELRDELLAPSPRTEKDIKQHIAEYYSMISHLDDAVGQILGKLEQKDLLENTIIVFAGDNGLALGKHGLMGKQSNYEHSVRVPLIFSGPGIPSDLKLDSFVYLFDVFPTLCELTGIKIPETVEGKSLVSAMNGDKTKIHNNLYFGYGTLTRSIKTDVYKLILYSYGKTNQIQLFNLVEDPEEIRNLADDITFSKTITDLYSKLLKLRDDWGDRDTEWGLEFWNRFEQNGGIKTVNS